MRSTLIYVIILSKCVHNMLINEIQDQGVEESVFSLVSLLIQNCSFLKILASTDSGQIGFLCGSSDKLKNIFFT